MYLATNRILHSYLRRFESERKDCLSTTFDVSVTLKVFLKPGTVFDDLQKSHEAFDIFGTFASSKTFEVSTVLLMHRLPQAAAMGTSEKEAPAYLIIVLIQSYF